MVTRITLTLALMTVSACGLEAEIFGPVFDRGHVVVPEPNDTFLHGQATGLSGGVVRLFTSGASGPGADVNVDASGLFAYVLPGTFEATGSLLWVEQGDQVALGVVPFVPAAESVFHEPREVFVWEQHELLKDLNSVTSAASMILYAIAARFSLSLDALPAEVIRETYDNILLAAAEPGSAAHDFTLAVSTLDAALSAAAMPRYRVDALGGDGSFLSSEWLQSAQVDYDGDGVIDLDTVPFDALLDEASLVPLANVCFDEEFISVVFHVDLRSGRLNANCSEVDNFKHTKPNPAKSVFFTGGIHEDSRVCASPEASNCLTEAQIDAANAELGDWVPNMIPMVDDGTSGDAQANDGIWTATFVLPYLSTGACSAPEHSERAPCEEAGETWSEIGVRLGYKYTFGQAAQDWTDSEEWPGNRRLLELVDLNGDRIISRYDIFGDETANKDFANQLSPAQSGCGFVTWEADTPEGCAGDTRENRVGLEGTTAACDGEADALGTWNDPGPVAPLTIPCSGE